MLSFVPQDEVTHSGAVGGDVHLSRWFAARQEQERRG